jgi:heterodisulfide reductase subunit C
MGPAPLHNAHKPWAPYLGLFGGARLRVEISANVVQSDFVHEIEELSGQNMLQCYQCGECSSGCPVAAEMDVLPNTVIRLIQLGQEDAVMAAESPWVCASCYTCYVRCPKGVGIAQIMEAVRLRHLRVATHGDHFNIRDLPEETRANLPPIAIISCARKFSQ